jgi:phytoene desaturase
VRRRFADPRLHRLFSFQAKYAGLSPDSALALYAMITHMDTIEGVWFPEGGMHAVPMIMAQVAEKAGATFRYGDAVETILRSPTGRLAGVRTSSGARIMAGILDLPTAFEQLRARSSSTTSCATGQVLAFRCRLACRRTRGAELSNISPQHPLR